jgi:hypothetical protein
VIEMIQAETIELVRFFGIELQMKYIGSIAGIRDDLSIIYHSYPITDIRTVPAILHELGHAIIIKRIGIEKHRVLYRTNSDVRKLFERWAWKIAFMLLDYMGEERPQELANKCLATYGTSL